MQNRDAKATTSALKDAISKADAIAGEGAEAPAGVEKPGNPMGMEASSAGAAATDAAKEAGVEQTLDSPKEQERMQATIKDALENEGIWA